MADSAIAADETASEGQSSSADRIAAFGEQLKGLSAKSLEISSAISGLPGIGKASGMFADFGGLLGKASDTVANVATAITENKDGGAVGQTLGVAQAILGGLTGGSSAEGGQENGEEGDKEDSFLEKAKEKVSQLKSIWDEYYTDLFDQEGKLNLTKAKNLALEVGDAILGTKKMAKIRKAFAIGEVVRDGAKAVMKAAAAKPFPANLPGIAFAVAQTASQLGIVKGQAHDGLDKVPSTGTYLLEKGERVVDKRLNRDLTDYLKAMPGGTVNNRENTVNNSPSVNLTINGDADPDAVRSNRGALESMIRDIFSEHALVAPF